VNVSSTRKGDRINDRAALEVPTIEYRKDGYECVANADAIVIVTEWQEFRAHDLDRLKREMRQHVIVDLRKVYRPGELNQRGFVDESVGRSKVRSQDCAPALRRPVLVRSFTSVGLERHFLRG
jgi:UDP-glucose/GDP-mannose dehydrogenase family, UDP binding domain